jgi:hypothetical protein
MTPWTNHSPLELDHNETLLSDICVRGESVSEWLSRGLWEEAEAYLKERYVPELDEATKLKIEKMDRRDKLAERVA